MIQSMNILEKNLLVLASAGSGKTYTLSDRIIGLLAMGVPPEKIIALTFTRKAAGEFAEAILRKLAEAASNPAKAAQLEEKFHSANINFLALLETVTTSLPKFTLGTMDMFFAKVVRGFQYELGLTGGRFELLEGPVAEIIKAELTETMFEAGTADAEEEAEFIRIFRRATTGTEGTAVIEELRRFIKTWHLILKSNPNRQWGPAELAKADISAWEKQKNELIAQIRHDLENITTNHGRQRSALEPMLDAFQQHSIGSGSLGKAKGLVPGILQAATEGTGHLEISFFKPFTIDGIAGQALRQLATLAARCEFAAALSRTRGIHGVLHRYEKLVNSELRLKGRLDFDDVKRLMGQWMKNEDARLRREAVDFRLDANYHHWLLDEFQDTSRDDWNALLPLVNEAISDNESTVFIVGDRKQAIFAWRGGEVGLFDELRENYGKGIAEAHMEESWRSCPEVLALVNHVCGDKATMEMMFGPVSAKWHWQDHRSAAPMARADYSGYARVEVIDPKETDKMELVVGTLHEIGIGLKQLSCGILLPSNKDVTEWAERLRSEGFEVVEEGQRAPAKDHEVGILIWQILKWLADPADGFAREIIAMSPLAPSLNERFGQSWHAVWKKLSSLVSNHGLAIAISETISPISLDLGNFGKRRATDLIESLSQMDNEGVVTAREAAARLERLTITQSPGVAAIQIMTIHKSKGLGFDVVILPKIPSEVIPSPKHFETVFGETWLSEAPAQWARKIIPEIRHAEQRWAESQMYESFCKLYVAITRAKRCLYIFPDKPSKTADLEKSSLAFWLLNSLGISDNTSRPYESGRKDWHLSTPPLEKSAPAAASHLGPISGKRTRTNPSGQKSTFANTPTSGKGRLFGSIVHRAFESITWIDQTDPQIPSEVRDIVQETLSIPEISTLFQRSDRNIELHREQPIEAVFENKWMSGIIDRLHIHRDNDGQITHLEIIDFKTDKATNAAELSERYTSQMESYRHALSHIYPNTIIHCILVSTALKTLVRLPQTS